MTGEQISRMIDADKDPAIFNQRCVCCDAPCAGTCDGEPCCLECYESGRLKAHLATRTPAPEAVAGEQVVLLLKENGFKIIRSNKTADNVLALALESECGLGVDIYPTGVAVVVITQGPDKGIYEFKAGEGEDMLFVLNASKAYAAPTPPVEAGKDAEIAKGHVASVHLADKLLTRSAKGFDYLVSFGGGRGPDVWDNERTVNGVDIHDALSQARGLVEDSDGWIFRIEQNDHPPTTRDKLESDLTTARATITEMRVALNLAAQRFDTLNEHGFCRDCINAAALAHAAEGKEQA